MWANSSVDLKRLALTLVARTVAWKSHHSMTRKHWTMALANLSPTSLIKNHHCFPRNLLNLRVHPKMIKFLVQMKVIGLLYDNTTILFFSSGFIWILQEIVNYIFILIFFFDVKEMKIIMNSILLQVAYVVHCIKCLYTYHATSKHSCDIKTRLLRGVLEGSLTSAVWRSIVFRAWLIGRVVELVILGDESWNQKIRYPISNQ